MINIIHTFMYCLRSVMLTTIPVTGLIYRNMTSLHEHDILAWTWYPCMNMTSLLEHSILARTWYPCMDMTSLHAQYWKDLNGLSGDYSITSLGSTFYFNKLVILKVCSDHVQRQWENMNAHSLNWECHFATTSDRVNILFCDHVSTWTLQHNTCRMLHNSRKNNLPCPSGGLQLKGRTCDKVSDVLKSCNLPHIAMGNNASSYDISSMSQHFVNMSIASVGILNM